MWGSNSGLLGQEWHCFSNEASQAPLPDATPESGNTSFYLSTLKQTIGRLIFRCATIAETQSEGWGDNRFLQVGLEGNPLQVPQVNHAHSSLLLDPGRDDRGKGHVLAIAKIISLSRFLTKPLQKKKKIIRCQYRAADTKVNYFSPDARPSLTWLDHFTKLCRSQGHSLSI